MALGQGSNQGSQVEVFGPVKASVVKNGGISDGGDRDISCYRLRECAQTGYLNKAERPETREKLCFRPKHQSHNPGGGNTDHIHRVRELNDRIRERVGHTTRRRQSILRPENPGGISDHWRRHHLSSLGGGMVCQVGGPGMRAVMLYVLRDGINSQFGFRLHLRDAGARAP